MLLCCSLTPRKVFPPFSVLAHLHSALPPLFRRGSPCVYRCRHARSLARVATTPSVRGSIRFDWEPSLICSQPWVFLPLNQPTTAMPELEKIRSTKHENELDRKIEEIRRKNEILEERHEIVTKEALQNAVPKHSSISIVHSSGNKKGKAGSDAPLETSETEKSPVSETKGNQWSREWDQGKTAADQWKVNVPDFGDHDNAYFRINDHPRGRGARGSGNQRGSRRPQPSRRNPGFFHDDRCEPPTALPADVESEPTANGHNASPRGKPADTRGRPHRRGAYNDRNQNDSNKPNMNIRDGGSANRNQSRQQQPGAAAASRNGRKPSGGAKNGPKSEGDRPPAGNKRHPGNKFDGKSQPPQAVLANVGDKRIRNGPKNRSEKPATAPKATPSEGNRSTKTSNKQKDRKAALPSRRQNHIPRLDKDERIIRGLVDNIVNRVVMLERKERQKHSSVPREPDDTDVVPPTAAEPDSAEPVADSADSKLAKVETEPPATTENYAPPSAPLVAVVDA